MKHLLRDVEVVVHFLKTRLKVPHFVVHGQSLGGMLATHVAPHASLLVADRTYSSLHDVANSM